MGKQYWLMKSEPDVFSFEDLKKAHKQTTFWDGVRNYEARNFLRDKIKKGDGVLYYHSNAEPSGVAGLAVVVKEGYPDPTQFDPKDDHYDADSKKDEPRWYGVDVQYGEAFKKMVTLEDIRKTPALKNMMLLKRGRLSVTPVTPEEWKIILKLGGL
ncbi:MAG: EVE domain-containing protein [Bdellovibrionota bacterium]